MTTFNELLDSPSGLYVDYVPASSVVALRESVAGGLSTPFTVEDLDAAISSGNVNQLLDPCGGMLRALGLIETREMTVKEMVDSQVLSVHW